MTTSEKAQIQRIMEGLKCSEDEAKEIIAYDKAIDKAKAKDRLEHDLTIEQEKEAKKFGNVKEHKQTAYKWTTRERKKNPTKSAIITEIAKFLEENSENACENVEITNSERQISFRCGENLYEFTLVQKRIKKSEN